MHDGKDRKKWKNAGESGSVSAAPALKAWRPRFGAQNTLKFKGAVWCRLAVPALWRQTRKDPCYSLAWNWPRRLDWLATEPSGAAFFCLRNAGFASVCHHAWTTQAASGDVTGAPCAYNSSPLFPGPIFPSFLMKRSFSLDFPKPFNMITRFFYVVFIQSFTFKLPCSKTYQS